MGEISIKDRGVLPRYVRLWVLERFGEQGIANVSNRLNPASRAMFTKPIPHEWYPVELIKELFDAVATEFLTEFPDSLDSLGAFIAEKSVKGFLSYLVRLVSMNQVLSRLGAIWKRYHNAGTINSEVTVDRGNYKQGVLTVKDYDAGPYWCEIMNSYIKTFIELTGVKNVSVEKRSCIHREDPVCSWEIGWED